MINGVTDPVHAARQPSARSRAPVGEEAWAAKAGFGQADAVELSEAARQQVEGGLSAPIRTGLVERVRAEIAAGTYLTEDKLDALVDRVHEEMFAVA